FQRVGTTDVGILRLLPSHHPLSSDTGKISSCNLSGSHPFAKSAKGWGSLNLWLRKRVGQPPAADRWDSGRTRRCSLNRQMRGDEADELSRCDDLGIFPEFWEVPLVAGNQVVGAGRV